VWVDDPAFDVRDHVRALACPAPRDEQALLNAALSLIEEPLPKSRPLWAAMLVTGLPDDHAGLVFVLHHVLADGVGGLAVLAGLVDGRDPPPESGFPHPAPAASALAREALRTKLRALRNIRRSWRLLRSSLSAGGGLHPPRAAASSLNQRTGSRRLVAAVHADLSAVRAAAHAHGATVNDAVLVAVAGALHRVLAARGEHVDTIVVAVPVSGRDPASDAALGNMVSPLLVPVEGSGEMGPRMEQVAGRIRASKSAATGPAPIAVLGWLFRPLARLGGYWYYMNHQHRLHTLVSHVRGPADQLSFGGSPVLSAVPVSISRGGNITVYFEVLSYAGILTIAVIADAGHFRSLDDLTDALRAELGLIAASGSQAGRPASC